MPRSARSGTSGTLAGRELCIAARGGLQEKVALHHSAGNIVNAGVVLPCVPAECLERIIDGGLSPSGEHAFGLLDDEPRVQCLLQLFGGALLLPCSGSVSQVARCD